MNLTSGVRLGAMPRTIFCGFVLGYFACCSVAISSVTRVVTVSSVDDTYITQYGNPLGDANSTHGGSTSLYSILNPPGAHLWCFPLVRFDLSPYAGQTVLGQATLSMYVQGTDFGVQYLRQESVHRVLVPWSGATASYNNFGPAPGVNNGIDIGSALDTITVDYPGAGNRYVTWSIPADVIQAWIDTPSSNYGLLLFNNSPGDLQFGSRESAHPPLLAFVVPEPGSLGVLCIGLIWLIRRRRK